MGPSFADLCSMIKHLLRTLMQFVIGSFVFLLEVCAGSLRALDPSLEKEMATHSSILAWKIPWTKKAVRLQSRGLQRVGHD